MHWVLIILTFDPNSTAATNVAMQEFSDEPSCVAAGMHTVDAIGQIEPKYKRGVRMLCEQQSGPPGLPPSAIAPAAPSSDQR